MGADQMTLCLTASESVVFFEFLYRFCNDGKLAIEHESEERVLINILCLMESMLTAPFTADYSKQLDRARTELINRQIA